MNEPRFEWDIRKAVGNLRKHGVSFEEAKTVFSDDNALLLDDPAHSGVEARFMLLGLSESWRLLVVVHTLRDRGEFIRLISARRATRHERQQYFDRVRP